MSALLQLSGWLAKSEDDDAQPKKEPGPRSFKPKKLKATHKFKGRRVHVSREFKDGANKAPHTHIHDLNGNIIQTFHPSDHGLVQGMQHPGGELQRIKPKKKRRSMKKALTDAKDSSGEAYEVYSYTDAGKRVRHQVYSDRGKAYQHLTSLKKLYGADLHAGVKPIPKKHGNSYEQVVQKCEALLSEK